MQCLLLTMYHVLCYLCNMAKGKDDKKYTPAQIMALKSSIGPRATEAFTRPGQKPSSLAPSRRDGKGLMAPLSKNVPTSQKAFDALNTAGRVAAESVILGAGGAAAIRGATRLAAKGLGGYVGRISTESALNQNMKGLWNASGMGGKVSRTQTPFGPTLRSTAVGTEAQQAARIGNLTVGAEKKAVGTGSGAGTKVITDIFKVGNKTKQVGANLGGIAITGKNRRSK